MRLPSPLAAVLPLAVVASAVVMSAVAHATPLDDALAALARKSRSTVGVYVEHLERRETAGVNASRPFPMASTFKLPLAVVTMGAIARKELPPLDGKVRLLPGDMLPFASPLQKRFPQGGEVVLREVLASLLEASDNSAADGLLRLDGGPAKVTAALGKLGLDGIRIDRGERQIGDDVHGDGDAARRAAYARFRADPRDHASPAAMGRVLAKLWRGELGLAPDAAAFLQAELTRCHTGLGRLRAGLPPEARDKAADRTGTCGGPTEDGPVCANDIGLLLLPSGEHVVVAVMIEDAGGPEADKNQTMAAVAAAVWQHYATPQRR